MSFVELPKCAGSTFPQTAFNICKKIYFIFLCWRANEVSQRQFNPKRYYPELIGLNFTSRCIFFLVVTKWV